MGYKAENNGNRFDGSYFLFTSGQKPFCGKFKVIRMKPDSLAPSTRIRIFWKTHLFYPFWVRVHTETAFSVTENEAFRKRSPEWIFLKTPFSCCRVDE